MPQRIKNIHLVSTEIQGSDSWVDIKPLTVEQYNRATDLVLEARESEVDQAVRAALDLKQRELFAEVVAGWNWVDNDDKPLPSPAGNPGVFELLTMAELNYIGEAINKGMTIEKKDGKKSKR
jgi:hypothetical protein